MKTVFLSLIRGLLISAFMCGLWVPQPARGAYAFVAASSQYLNTASTPVTAVPLTIACWARLDNTTGPKGLVSIDRPDNPSRFQLVVVNDIINAGVVTIFNGGSNSTISGLSANTLYHFAGVYSSNTSRTVYRNGVAGTTDTGNYTPAGLSVIYIGAIRGVSAISAFHSGMIAEVGIWSAALTADEIASLAKGFTPDQIRPQSLVFYAPLIRDLIDYKGGLTITNNNAATVARHPRTYQ
jgi:hypothetical protein